MALEIRSPGNYCAGLYIRLSKEDESEGPSESVTNQKSLLEDFVRRQGLRVFDVYIDDGWSGTNFDRPAFRRMLRDIEDGKVNLVVTKDLSRLGRDYILTGHYMERYFPEHRVRYVSLLDGIDTGVDSSANDITPFRAIMNDMYAKDISKKIASVKHDKQRKGLFIGGKPVYGYKMHPAEKNKIVIDEGAAPTVRRIFAMAQEGISCRQIAARLNGEGVPTPAVYARLPAGRPGASLWSGERIADMLRNETYAGNMVQGRSRKVSYKSKKCRRLAPEDWVVVAGTHEPLISREAFDQVQRLLESRRHTRSRTYDFPLKGLIFCHECGRPLAVVNRKNAKGEDVLYFVCRTYQRFTKAGGCTCHSVKEAAVMEAVAGTLRRLCGQYLLPQTLLPAAREALRQAAGGGQSVKGQMQELQKRLELLNARLERLYGDRLSGLLDEEDFRRLYERYREERAALAQRQQALAQEEAPASGRDAAESLARRFADGAFTSRELLVRLIERVELTEDKELLIAFRFREPENPPAG
ncbi:MAG TPA: recombinase family protein [Firmicutes bacterium]|nr:recombinase family protein [Bacillota bacterium]